MRRRQFLGRAGAGSLAALYFPRADFFAAENAAVNARSDIIGELDPRVEVSLDHIAWNFSQVKKRVKVRVMAVVKANGYGHGLVEVSRALERAGADWLMVGKLQEAAALREAGVKCPVLNFGSFTRDDSEAIVRLNISQSVYTEEAVYLNEAASRSGKRAGVHIDIDTGMGRTGVPFSNALTFAEKIAAMPNLRVEGVMTTLAEDLEFDREQLRRFLGVCSAARQKGLSLGLRHVASSAGVFESSEFYLDMIRPGITLYGYYPNARTQKEDLLGLRPALKLTAHVIFIKELGPGDSLSYLRVFTAREKMRVATASIGYSDGYPPQFGGKAHVAIRGKKFSVTEAVTSNHVMIDLKNDPEIRIGDEVVLIDTQKESGLTADVLGEASGVSDYKILIGLSPSLPRKFRG
jgi:alanine racemase